MFSHFYQKNIIEKPKIIFVILLLSLASFGFFSKDFKLDASSETLLIEGDPDLKRIADTPPLTVNTNKLQRATNWRPEIPFEQTLLDLLNYERERAQLFEQEAAL